MTASLELEVAHAVLYVRDSAKMIDFYTRVLGFEVTDRGPLGRPGGAEIIFLSQTPRHHHQVAFVDTRAEPGKSNNLDHVAYRTKGSLADLKALYEVLKAEPEVTNIRPLTHGNAWSVYFSDPEGNGVEIFLDTPWYVAQPEGHPIDLEQPVEEIAAWTEQHYRETRPEFSPIEDFYAKRAEHLASRGRA